ncbi:MAG: phosphoesterase RecJ domain-containing protein [Clostridiales bacterium]|jgi:phosphoesterase RecJ-like protein|nr:phosphoesterase RecJ domain-containing protein [Clostridiales bacterium]
MFSLSQTLQALRKNNNFLIISHHRPDGDALGSAAGLCNGLRELGKNAYILENPQTTSRYLPYVEKYHAPEDYSPDFIISVDTADEEIIQINAEKLIGKIDLSIDHHKSNKMYAKESFIMSEYASCGEIIYHVLMELAGSVSYETAQLLYIAVSTDTGCFRYKNTTANTLKTAAALVEAGAQNGIINKKIFMTKTKSRVKLEGYIINSLEFFKENQLVIAAITREMIDKAGADEDDMEDIAVVAGQIEGVETSITITELRDNLCKVSVRTVNYANADDICSQYGGGGHGMAAGCTLECSIEEAKRLMLAAAEKVWKKI